MKISISMYHNGSIAEFPRNKYHDIMEGCMETLDRLRTYSEMVEAICITWTTSLPGTYPNFEIKVHFHDPLGEKRSYTTDMSLLDRDIPFSESIPRHLCDVHCLPKLISDHLEKCRRRLDAAKHQLVVVDWGKQS